MQRVKTTLVASVTVMMVLACGAAGGAEYFLAPTGDDANLGTRAAPWLTLAKAGAMARAGDTVTLLAGEYPGTLVPANSGTAEQPIVFRAEPRRSARLIGNGDISYSILLHNLSHIRIEGLYIGPQPKQGRCTCRRAVPTATSSCAGMSFTPPGDATSSTSELKKRSFSTILSRIAFNSGQSGSAKREIRHHLRDFPL